MKPWLLFLGIVLVSVTLGQTPIYFHYNTQDGLPSDQIYCAIQDNRGFIWFGTDNGLTRFDGVEFQIFGVKDGLSDPEVINLKVDTLNRIWIFCFRKEFSYWENNRINSWKFDSLPKLKNNQFNMLDVFRSRRSHYWISTGGVDNYKLNGASLSKIRFCDAIMLFDEIDEQLVGLGTTSILRVEGDTSKSILLGNYTHLHTH